MPTYDYRCEKCGGEVEVTRPMGTDSAVSPHAGCGGRLRQLLRLGGVSFKGKGFYKTDGRGAK